MSYTEVDMIYKIWLKEWLENYVKVSVKKRTYDRYKQIVDNHLITDLGEKEMSEISLLDLQRYVTKLLTNGNIKTGAGLSNNSVNGIINIIQGSLEAAYDVKLITEYTANRIKRPKAMDVEVECFCVAEQKKIEKEVLLNLNTKNIGYILCLYTGLRIGELLALTWQDVDMIKKELHITKTTYDGKDQQGKHCRVISTPKTLSSKRIIPLPDKIVILLRKYRKINNGEFIISHKNQPISVRSYQQSFTIFLRKIKVERKKFHCLRHTFATRAIEIGMDIKTLSEIMGHKTPYITMSRYCHSLIEHKKTMMNKLGRIMLDIE